MGQLPKLSDCTDNSSDSRIKISECGRQAVFLNATRKAFRIVRADACLYTGVEAADWIVCGPEGDVIVELKGCDVSHALDQVVNTMRMWRKDRDVAAKMVGLIVCSRVPRFDSKIQRAKLTVAKDFRTKLHVCSRNQEHEFSKLF